MLTSVFLDVVLNVKPFKNTFNEMCHLPELYEEKHPLVFKVTTLKMHTCFTSYHADDHADVSPSTPASVQTAALRSRPRALGLHFEMAQKIMTHTDSGRAESGRAGPQRRGRDG